MPGGGFNGNGDHWYFIPAEKRRAWWLHLIDAGQCRILGLPAPPLPDYAAPVLYPAVSAHDPLLPIEGHDGLILVPGSLDVHSPEL